MSIAIFNGFPRQQLSYKQKGFKWGKQCVDFADAKGSIMNFSPVKFSVMHKRINYDLMNMKIHKEDIAYVLNPNKLKANFVPDTLQHYPTINAYLNLLQGEAISRPFDWHVVVTNPNAIGDIERQKRKPFFKACKNLFKTSQCLKKTTSVGLMSRMIISCMSTRT